MRKASSSFPLRQTHNPLIERTVSGGFSPASNRRSCRTLGIMKTAAWLGVSVASLLVGLGGGLYLGFEFSRSHTFAEESLAFGRELEALNAARTSGSDAAYEEALRAHIASLQRNQRSSQPWMNDKGFAVDYALTYVRLSKLAAKRGANEETSRLLEQAASLCPAIGWQDCSAQRILAFAEEVDGNLAKKEGKRE